MIILCTPRSPELSYSLRFSD